MIAGPLGWDRATISREIKRLVAVRVKMLCYNNISHNIPYGTHRRFRWCCFLTQTAFYEIVDFHGNKRFLSVASVAEYARFAAGIKREPFMPVNIADNFVWRRER